MIKKKKHPKQLSLHRLIPNMITLAAMASGMTAVKFAIAGKWEAAALAIVVATFMDAFDGAAARLLKASSALGAELDSLSDFVSFGVMPALVLYLWSMENLGRWGWFIVLVYAMALALRLARFNVQKEEDTEEDALSNGYFTGVPAPCVAGLSLLPMIVTFLLEDYGYADVAFLRLPVVTGGWLLFLAFLAVSRIPTFSTKQLHISYRFRIVALSSFALFFAALINDPWPTLTLMGIVYLGMMPVTVWHYIAARKKTGDLNLGP